MPKEVRWIVTATLLSGMIATQAEDFESANLRCSASCMQITARTNDSDAKAAELATTASVRTKYLALADRIESTNTFQAANLYINVELPTSFAKDAADLLPVGGNAASDLVDKGVEALRDWNNKKVAGILRAGLQELEKEDPNLTAFSTQPEAQRLGRIEDALRKLDVLGSEEKLFEMIDDPVQQNELQQSAIRLLTTGLKELKQQVVQNVDDIRSVRGEMGKVSKELKTLKSAKEEVQKAQEKVVEKASAAATTATAAAKDVLESQRRAAVRDFVRAAQNAATQAEAVAGIAAELGAPEIARVANIAAGAMDVASGIAMCSVNPAAILPTVLSGIKFIKGLGGKKGPDPLAQQLAQIVALQKQILDRLVEMEKTLRENHAEVINGLGAINNNVLISLQWLRESVAADLKACVPLLPPGSYVPLDDDPDRGGFLVVGAVTRFSTYEAFVQYATRKNAKDFIGVCKQALYKNFGLIDGSIAQIFTLQNTSFVKSDKVPAGVQGDLQQRVERYRRDVVVSSTTIVKQYIKQKFWYSFTDPAPTVASLRRNLERGEFSKDPAHVKRFDAHMSTPMNALAVGRYGGWLAGSHYYIELTDGNNLPFTRDALLSNTFTSSTVGLQLVEFGLLLSDVAVAQQSMESGHVLLPLAHAAWTKSDDEWFCTPWPGKDVLEIKTEELCSSEKKLTEAGQKRATQLRNMLFSQGDNSGLVRSNRLFTRNLVLFAVRDALDKTRAPVVSYELALQSELSSNMLSTLLGQPYKFEFSKDENPELGLKRGWTVDVAGVRVMLPTPGEVRSGQLVYQPEFAGLLDVRHRLARELAGNRFMRSLNSRDERTARQLLEAGVDLF